MAKRKRYSSKKLGFSLIEMAIVLMVLGLLTSLTLKGYDLLENAKLHSLVNQINQYRYAYLQFVEKYNALPGDFGFASLFINSDLPNGNNNGNLEGDGLDASMDAGKFWIHLAADGLIGDVGKSDGDILAFGKGAPTTSFHGGITIETNPDDLKGLWFIVGKPNHKRGTNGMLTPHQALQIMQKNDSPDPYYGRIQARNGANYPDECIRNGQLNVRGGRPSCILYFQV